MPAHDGLLARLDALVELTADRRGLALVADGRLAGGELRAAAAATGLGASDADSVELLRALAEAVGLLRARGGRLEATALRPAWDRVDPGLRAGLVYAAWCHRLRWAGLIGTGPDAKALTTGRRWVLRLLFRLPPAVAVDVPRLVATVADGLGLTAGDWADRAVAAAFLDPLVALGVAELEPAPPAPPAVLKLGPRAQVVIGSALVAAGEEVPLTGGTAN